MISGVGTRVKRTYNLPAETVQHVRELADEYGVAGSQDAVIELAVDELVRRLRETREAATWSTAGDDAELDELAHAYEAADAETWPR
jgi:hypothetical protein